LGAWRIDGIPLKPGQVVPEASLWPGPDWPRIPHLIEIFASEQSSSGHGGSRIDVILWRYESYEWRQVCRLEGYDSSAWMVMMEPIITQSLNESRPRVEPPDIHAIAERLAAPIAAELAALQSEEQREALATELYTRMMFIMSAEGGEAAG
jgi:hypothetical protein